MSRGNGMGYFLEWSGKASQEMIIKIEARRIQEPLTKSWGKTRCSGTWQKARLLSWGRGVADTITLAAVRRKGLGEQERKCDSQVVA